MHRATSSLSTIDSVRIDASRHVLFETHAAAGWALDLDAGVRWFNTDISYAF